MLWERREEIAVEAKPESKARELRKNMKPQARQQRISERKGTGRK